eukprot:scaffold278292_cov20-Tisochrysis_lutea.AAC.1
MLCTLEGISHARGEEYAGLMQGIDHCFASLPFCVSVVAVLAAVDTRKCFGAFFFSDQGLSPRVAVDTGAGVRLCSIMARCFCIAVKSMEKGRQLQGGYAVYETPTSHCYSRV